MLTYKEFLLEMVNLPSEITGISGGTIFISTRQVMVVELNFILIQIININV